MKYLCQTFCGIAALALVLLIVVLFDQSQVLTFGSPEKSYIKAITDNDPSVPPATVPSFAPGDLMRLCFADVTWFRTVPSRAKMFFLDVNSHRIDLDDKLGIASHDISLPPKPGKLDPKCRVETMPAGIPPGPAILTGVATSTDTFFGTTRTVTLEYPRMKLIVRAP